MSKHTPGPWIRDGLTVYSLVSNGFRKGIELFVNRFSVFIKAGRSCSAEEAEANARLIASAPELLEALIELRDGYLENVGLPAVRANAAIAKATGEQQ